MERRGTKIPTTWLLNPGPGAWLLTGLDGPGPSPPFMLFSSLFTTSLPLCL